jgi:uncharacterized membrane protein YccC
MNYLLLDKDRLTNSVKTALACLIGFIITKSTHLPVDQWLIITIIVVMCAQINVGSMIQKSTMRFLGTLAGSIVAAITLLTVGTDTVAAGCVITLSAMLFSYMATGKSNISESGTLGAVTVTIILVSQNPTLTTALGRFLEISAGILIAALVSQFILPIHARDALRRKQIQIIRLLRSYYLATFLANQNEEGSYDYHEIDEAIINSILTQRKLATEAISEPFAKKIMIVSQFSNLLWCEREMQRAITFMHHAYKSSPESKKIFSNMIILNDFHDKIGNAFETIATHLEDDTLKELEVELPSVQSIKNILRAEKNNLSQDDITYTNAFLFCAEILVARLSDLVHFIKQ